MRAKGCFLLGLSIALLLTACSDGREAGAGDLAGMESSRIENTAVQSPEPSDAGAAEGTANSLIKDTPIQSLEPEYIPIGETGAYDSSIITPELLKHYRMHEMTAQDVGYLTGYILEDKILRSFVVDADYKENPSHYVEDEIKYLHDNGFNCARALYSFSFASKPGDASLINESELKQLDELISWGLKYDVHIIISGTGIAGKGDYTTDIWDDSLREEMTDCIYTDSEQAELYRDYWEVLAERYAALPANVVSFEPAVESFVPGDDMELYTSVLAPVVEAVWSYNPERIVIANDVGHMPPEKLAQMGCCISLHDHIYSLYDDYGESSGFQNIPAWPRIHIPHSMSRGDEVGLNSDVGFEETTLTVYAEYADAPFEIRTDGNVLPSDGGSSDSDFVMTADIPDNTKSITLTAGGEAGVWAYELRQKDVKTTLATNWNEGHGVDAFPILTIHADGGYTLEQGVSMDHDFFYRTSLEDFIQCAKENRVSFLMTEIGTDVSLLSPEEYVAYHSQWLDLLKENNISWMYNCVHNILAPEDVMWLNRNNSKFTEFSEADIPGYLVNYEVMEMLKRYRQGE